MGGGRGELHPSREPSAKSRNPFRDLPSVYLLNHSEIPFPFALSEEAISLSEVPTHLPIRTAHSGAGSPLPPPLPFFPPFFPTRALLRFDSSVQVAVALRFDCVTVPSCAGSVLGSDSHRLLFVMGPMSTTSTCSSSHTLSRTCPREPNTWNELLNLAYHHEIGDIQHGFWCWNGAADISGHITLTDDVGAYSPPVPLGAGFARRAS